MKEMQQPTLAQKVSAAIYVLSMRPELPGVKTINTLMWPYMVPPLTPVSMLEEDAPAGPWILEPDDVRRQAAKVLASVHTALLEAVHPERSAQIWIEQVEYLSLAGEPALRDERIPTFREGVLHPPENIADWLSAFSGPCHPCQPGSAAGNSSS